MSRRVALALLAVLLVGLLVTVVVSYLQQARLDAHLVASRNNLRELSAFAAPPANPDPKAEGRLPGAVPAATVALPGVVPEERLSWAVTLLPNLDQKRHPTEQLVAKIRTDQPWSAEPNQSAGRTRLAVLLCPENTPQVPDGAPAVTCYVAVAGVGADAATLSLPAGATPPRAGAWRYDAPTPFDRIADGLSQTLLFGESADAPGPWLRGGPSTARGFDDAPGAKPLIRSHSR